MLTEADIVKKFNEWFAEGMESFHHPKTTLGFLHPESIGAQIRRWGWLLADNQNALRICKTELKAHNKVLVDGCMILSKATLDKLQRSKWWRCMHRTELALAKALKQWRTISHEQIWVFPPAKFHFGIDLAKDAAATPMQANKRAKAWADMKARLAEAEPVAATPETIGKFWAQGFAINLDGSITPMTARLGTLKYIPDYSELRRAERAEQQSLHGRRAAYSAAMEAWCATGIPAVPPLREDFGL